MQKIHLATSVAHGHEIIDEAVANKRVILVNTVMMMETDDHDYAMRLFRLMTMISHRLSGSLEEPVIWASEHPNKPTHKAIVAQIDRQKLTMIGIEAEEFERFAETKFDDLDASIISQVAEMFNLELRPVPTRH